ncbi:unnamed protein product [Rotaria sp. Silwood1]|nr:unnamed protein product [Rotaria sp. Silwood1]CAF3700678.1 unnamed protein product [Rotaria sp. Silwood1]
MHFSWFIHLSILVLLSLFLPVKTDYYEDYDDELESTIRTFKPSTTTASLVIEDSIEELEDHSVKPKTIESTTTHGKKVTTSHMDFIHDYGNIFDDDEEETEEEKFSQRTPVITKLSSSSSSSKIKLITHAITETSSTTSEIPVTHSTWLFSTLPHDSNIETSSTTTIDPKKVAVFLAKTNRDRLFLKIFAITVIVGMFSLALAFIIIYMVRKTQRYRKYHIPANGSLNEQTKHLTNIPV